MITFKSYLSEEVTKDSIYSAIKIIKRDCSQFLTSAKSEVLLRGISSAGFKRSKQIVGGLYFINHPHDRRPADSSDSFNFMFNLMFEDAYGIKDIRKNSFFATGNIAQANMYGDVVWCFPIGDSKMFNNNQISDSYEDQHIFYEYLATYVRNVNNEIDITEAEMQSCIKRIAEELDYSVGEFLKGSSYVKDVVNHEFNKYDSSINYDMISKALVYSCKSIYDTDNNYSRAIANKAEIIIYKSDGYYCLCESDIVNLFGNASLTFSDLKKIYKELFI